MLWIPCISQHRGKTRRVMHIRRDLRECIKEGFWTELFCTGQMGGSEEIPCCCPNNICSVQNRTLVASQDTKNRAVVKELRGGTELQDFLYSGALPTKLFWKGPL